jgi:hypothetical protein
MVFVPKPTRSLQDVLIFFNREKQVCNGSYLSKLSIRWLADSGEYETSPRLLIQMVSIFSENVDCSSAGNSKLKNCFSVV